MRQQTAVEAASAIEDAPPRLRGQLLRRLTGRPLTVAGAAIVVLFVATAVIGIFVTPRPPDALNYSAVLAPPSSAFPFGTDDLGRDIFSRIIAGAHISLLVGVVAIGLAMLCGAVLGLLAGYLGGWVDQSIMRLMDIMLAFPDILLAIVIIAILGPGLVNVIIAVGIGAVPVYTRTVRAAVLGIREQEFVEAARALGVPPWRIMRVHILRNIMAPIIVLATLGVGLAILIAAGLSFIGLGAQPPTPEWGDMLNEAQNYLQQAWWMAVFPGTAITLTVIGLNLLGDGLREMLDPTVR
jgi:peptide/nickel transport system permease protein